MSTTQITYKNNLFTFTYHAKAEIFEFSENAIRIVIRENDHQTFRYNIRPWTQKQSPEDAAYHVYKSMSEIPNDAINIPPYVFQGSQIGWRCRKRFVDGGKAPLIIEMIFYGTSEALYQLEFAAAPNIFQQGLKNFESLATSFVVL